MASYTVQQGDCISSIAQRHGLFWQTIWNDANNADLRAKRKSPNVLWPGDVLFLPDKEEGMHSGPTEKRHKFKKKGVPAKLRLKLEFNDKPRANEKYVLDIDGKRYTGTTDAEGRLARSIPPDARKGKLYLGTAPDQDVYDLDLGQMDPVDEVSGVQARLNNMGFDCGPVDGKMGPNTESALRGFQEKHKLPVTGRADAATRAKLVEIHGS